MDDFKRTEFGLIDRSDMEIGEPMPGSIGVFDSPIADHNEAQKVLLSVRALIDRLAEKPVKAIFMLVIEPNEKNEEFEEVTQITVGEAGALLQYLDLATETIIGDLVAYERQQDDK